MCDFIKDSLVQTMTLVDNLQQVASATAAAPAAPCSSTSSSEGTVSPPVSDGVWSGAPKEGGTSPCLVAVASSSPQEEVEAPVEDALDEKGAAKRPSESVPASGGGPSAAYLCESSSLLGALGAEAISQFILDSDALAAPPASTGADPVVSPCSSQTPGGLPPPSEDVLPPACPSPSLKVTRGPEALPIGGGGAKNLQGPPERNTALALAALNSPTALARAPSAAATPLAAASSVGASPQGPAAPTGSKGTLEAARAVLAELLEGLRLACCGSSSNGSSHKDDSEEGLRSTVDSSIGFHLHRIEKAQSLAELEPYLSALQGALPAVCGAGGAPSPSRFASVLRSLDVLVGKPAAATAATAKAPPATAPTAAAAAATPAAATDAGTAPKGAAASLGAPPADCSSSNSSSNSGSSKSLEGPACPVDEGAPRVYRYPPEGLEAQQVFCCRVLDALSQVYNEMSLKERGPPAAAVSSSLLSYHKALILGSRGPQQLFAYTHVIFKKLLLHAVHAAPALLLIAAAEGAILLPSDNPLDFLREAPLQAIDDAIAVLQVFYEFGKGAVGKGHAAAAAGAAGALADNPAAAAAAAAAAGGLRAGLSPAEAAAGAPGAAGAAAGARAAPAAVAPATSTPAPSLLCSPTVVSVEGAPDGESHPVVGLEGGSGRAPAAGAAESVCGSPLPPAAKAGPVGPLVQKGGELDAASVLRALVFPGLLEGSSPVKEAPHSKRAPAQLQQQQHGSSPAAKPAAANLMNLVGSPVGAPKNEQGEIAGTHHGPVASPESVASLWGPLGSLLSSPEVAAVKDPLFDSAGVGGGASSGTTGVQSSGVSSSPNVSFDATHNRWIAFWRSQGKNHSKSFSCSKYGGREAARLQALGFRKHLESSLLDTSRSGGPVVQAPPPAAGAAAMNAASDAATTAAAAADLRSVLAGLDACQEALAALQQPLFLSQGSASQKLLGRKGEGIASSLHVPSAPDFRDAAANCLVNGDPLSALSLLQQLNSSSSGNVNTTGAPRKSRARRVVAATPRVDGVGISPGAWSTLGPGKGSQGRPRNSSTRVRSTPNTPGGPRRLDAAAAAADEARRLCRVSSSSNLTEVPPNSPVPGSAEALWPAARSPQQPPQQQQQRLRVVSGSITFDRSQNRFMAQWKTSDGCKHSKSFYIKNYKSVEEAQLNALKFKENLLAERDSERSAAAVAAAAGGTAGTQLQVGRGGRARCGGVGGPKEVAGSPAGWKNDSARTLAAARDMLNEAAGRGSCSSSTGNNGLGEGGPPIHEALERVISRSVQSCIQEEGCGEKDEDLAALSSPLVGSIRAAVAAAAASSKLENDENHPSGAPSLPLAANLWEDMGAQQLEEGWASLCTGGDPIASCRSSPGYGVKRCRQPVATTPPPAAATGNPSFISSHEPHYKRLKHLLSVAAPLAPPTSPSMPTLLVRAREEGGTLPLALQQQTATNSDPGATLLEEGPAETAAESGKLTKTVRA